MTRKPSPSPPDGLGQQGLGRPVGISPDRPDLVDTVRAVLSTHASVAELAEAWLTAKRANESAEQAEKGNSDRARRADLGRWALLIAEAVGRSPTADDASPMERLDLDDLSEDVLGAAIAAAKRRWSDATIARMLSTLRGFTRWLYRTGRITTDPLELDRRAERPIWRVGKSKGDKTRDVPLPKLTVEAIDGWLGERVSPAEGRRALKARQIDPLGQSSRPASSSAAMSR